MATASLTNEVRDFRERRDWTQEELAQRTGLSRPEISAIETGRLVPSAAAALALAHAFGCSVESIFNLPQSVTGDNQPQWALEPPQSPARFWMAQVHDQLRLFPAESSELGYVPHDGVWDGKELQLHQEPSAVAARTLVLATCDPAVGLLAAELARTENIRLIVLRRSSREALQMLEAGLVHGAGVHLVGDAANNAGPAQASVVRIAEWESGVVLRSPPPSGGLARALREVRRWVWREPGSGARQCQDLVLQGSKVEPRHTVDSHSAVVEAVRSSWADAGVALRLSGTQAGLAFFSVRTEPYDIHLAADFSDDFRFTAFLRVVRSKRFRALLSELPGYSTAHTGEVRKEKTHVTNKHQGEQKR